MPLARFWQWFIATIFIVFLAPHAWTLPVQPVPALSARVIDQTGTLDASQRAALEHPQNWLLQAAGCAPLAQQRGEPRSGMGGAYPLARSPT